MRKLSVIFLTILAAISAAAQTQEGSQVRRLDDALDDIVPRGASVEKVADNLGFVEGPVWVRKGAYLLFSDIPANVIDRWDPKDGKVSIFLEHSGLTGTQPADTNMPPQNPGTGIGSNGVTLDPQGRVVYCARGNRQIVRLEKNGRRTVLAGQYNGTPLNRPNDIVYKSDGSLYFTDPFAPIGGWDKYPKKDLPLSAVYLLKGGKLQLLVKDMPGPNGLAFSPGEKYLYINDSTKKLILRFAVQPDDTIARGEVFIETGADKAPGNPDGMKVDQKGNVYCSGPGGIWIISPGGKHLGTILTPEIVANLTFGDADGKTLFITARTGLYRIRVRIPGIRP